MLVLLISAAVAIYTIINLDFITGLNLRDIIIAYNVLAGVQFGFILMIVPAITAGQINGERDRQTLDLLMVTKMSTLSIVLGKLASSLVLVLLMIIASIPVFSVFVYFGTVSAGNLLALALFMMVTACMVGAVSIFCSILFRRVVVAYVASYLFVLVLIVGTLLAVFVMFRVQLGAFNMQAGGVSMIPFMLPLAWREFFAALMSLNPMVGFVSLMEYQSGFEFMRIVNRVLFSFHDVRLVLPLSFWMINTGFSVVLLAVLVGLSTHILGRARKV